MKRIVLSEKNSDSQQGSFKQFIGYRNETDPLPGLHKTYSNEWI